MKKSNIDSKKKAYIKKLFSSVSKQPLNNNPTSIEIFKKQLLEIFKLEVASMDLNYTENNSNSGISFEYVLDLSSDWLGRCSVDQKYDQSMDKYVIRKSKVSINQDSTFFHNLYSNDTKKRLESCKRILEVLYHELKHYRQHELMSIKYPSKTLLDMEKEYLVLDEMNTDEFYNDNHDSFMFEADARLDSYLKTESYEQYYPRKNVDYVYRKNDMTFAQVKVLNDENEYDVFDRETYMNSFVDNIICNRVVKDYLKKYPALTYEYNSNCTRKTIIELYSDYKKKINSISTEKNLSEEEKNKIITDLKELYYELFYSQLTRTYDSLYDIFLDKYDSDEIYDFLDEIKEHFRLKRIKKSALSSDNFSLKSSKRTDSTRYIGTNDGFVEVSKGIRKKLVDVNEYSQKIEVQSAMERRRISRVIPRCGYYILRNGGKVSAVEFINKLIKDISYDADANGVKKIIDYNKLISSLVKPEEEVEHILNLENINRDYQFQVLFLNAQQKHIQKRKTKKIIKKMWEKQSIGNNYKYYFSNANVQSIKVDDEEITVRR